MDSEMVFVVAFTVLIFNTIIAAVFGDVAEKKGYSNATYAVLVFFLGLIGCLVVVALPNQKDNSDTSASEHKGTIEQVTQDETSILYRQTNCLYTEGAPVVVTNGQLVKNNTTGDIYIQLRLTNITPNPVIAVVVQITPYDYAGRECADKIKYRYLDLHAEQDAVFGTNEDLFVEDKTVRYFQVAVTEVVFADKSIWQGNDTPWSDLKLLTPLEEKFEDPEMVKQYKLQLGDECDYFPTVNLEKKLWTCACGAFNSTASSVCRKCHRSYKDMASPAVLQDIMQAKEKRLIEAKQQEEKEKEEEKKAERTYAIIVGIVITITYLSLIIASIIDSY